MRAFAFDDFGKAPSLRDLPVPTPGEGEVRVRVQSSSVNAFDLMVAKGYMKGRMDHRFPAILGGDFAGVVDAIGSGVTGLSVGEDVFGVVSKPYLGGGSFADFVTVIPKVGLARRPKGVPVEAAGALGVAGTTARLTVDALALSPGQSVLVVGAPGGVGSFAVQLAAARGVRVIATAKPDEADHVRSLGAAETVDPETVFAQVKSLVPGGVDAVAHLAGDAQVAARLVVRGGRLASTVGAGPEQLAAFPLTATAIMAAMPSGELLSQLADLVAERRLRVPIFRTYTLEELPQALADFARTGKRGKSAIAVSR